MNKVIKIGILVVVLGIALYNSVSIKDLDEVRESKLDSAFSAKTYANEFMSNKVESLAAISASVFLDDISKNPEDYCKQKGKKLGISDEYNFIVEGDASISSIGEEYIVAKLKNDKDLRIATDFIFGNAIRDGSAMADIGDYQNTMDFNSISVELNNIVRETIIPSLSEKAIVGNEFYFKGAVKIDITDPEINKAKIIPITIRFKD